MAVNTNPPDINPADTVTRYLGQDANISVAQLGNISAVQAIADEIGDVSSGLTDMGNSMKQLQTMHDQALSEQQRRQDAVNALSGQVAAQQAKVANETPTSSHSKSTNTQLPSDQQSLGSMQQQLSTASFQLVAQQGYVAGLQKQINDLQGQINAAQTQLNNLRTQAMPAAQEVDDQNRQQRQSTHTSNPGAQQNGSNSAQMTLASRLKAQVTLGNSAASILDGLPYDEEKRQSASGDGGSGGGGGSSGGGGVGSASGSGSVGGGGGGIAG